MRFNILRIEQVNEPHLTGATNYQGMQIRRGVAGLRNNLQPKKSFNVFFQIQSTDQKRNSIVEIFLEPTELRFVLLFS